MLGLGRKNAPRLLKTVGGKPHASDKDHEETYEPQNDDSTSRFNEEQLNQEPVSSGDEEHAPLIPPSARLSNPANLAQKRKAGSESPGLKKPQPKSVKKASTFRVPSPGNFQRGKDFKESRGLGEKEKPTTAPSSSKTEVDDGFDFGLHSQPSSQSRSQKKQLYGANRNGTSNIHARPSDAKSGPKKPITFTKKTRPIYNSKDEAISDSDEDLCMPLVGDELDEALGPGEDESASDAQLRKPVAKKKRINNDNDASEATGFDDGELEALLKSSQSHKSQLYKPTAKKKRTDDELNTTLELPQLRQPTRKKRTDDDDSYPSEVTAIKDDDELNTILGPEPALLLQLGEWMQDRTPDSSQPQSSAPQEDIVDIDNIEGYIDDLPEEAPEGTICTICREPVSPSDYWTFWTHKPKTVKNQTAFCTSHRRQTAQDEYTREGYPTIDWAALPSRIKQHRMTLHKVLTNDTSSAFRSRYAPLALTGKAAAVPSRRSGTDSSYTLDDHSTYPGYYGARGRRAITEAVMALLRNEIKRSRDAVVQTSGPAAFVQAVLVPEVAVLLIMDDCAVDRDEAEGIRERTYEMGLLLNEEIEDEIEVREDSDGDEYGAR